MGNPWPKNDNDYRNQHLFDIARALERIEASMQAYVAHVNRAAVATEQLTRVLEDLLAERRKGPGAGPRKP